MDKPKKYVIVVYDNENFNHEYLTQALIEAFIFNWQQAAQYVLLIQSKKSCMIKTSNVKKSFDEALKTLEFWKIKAEVQLNNAKVS